MIPTIEQAKLLWDKYNLPPQKRNHVELVARVAVFFAQKLLALPVLPVGRQVGGSINEPLLLTAALLHDIDKNIPKNPGEHHPDTGVRILNEEGMREVAEIVKTHSLHAILDSNISPKSWEEKLLYLADKMVKHEIITVDQRFDLWRAEDLPVDAKEMLEKTYPLVKKLEAEVLGLLDLKPEDIKNLA